MMRQNKKQSQAGRLTAEMVRNRREFLKNVAKKAAIPAVAIYTVHKTATPAMGFTPI